jgi:glutathione S-transferase
MKLYLTPGACSLADHIALHEAGLAFDRVRVDLKTKRTEDGRDFNQINPKGYVPALVLDDGQLLTENVAICAGSPSARRSCRQPASSAASA